MVAIWAGIMAEKKRPELAPRPFETLEIDVAQRSRTSTNRPLIAAAAAIAGLTRWVRPLKP